MNQQPALSRKDLAERLGYSVRTIQKIEARLPEVRRARITTGSASVRYRPSVLRDLLGRDG